MMSHYPKGPGFKFQFNRKLFVCMRILQQTPCYCVSLIMVTLTSHILTSCKRYNSITAVKFIRGFEKNVSFLLISKSQKV